MMIKSKAQRDATFRLILVLILLTSLTTDAAGQTTQTPKQQNPPAGKPSPSPPVEDDDGEVIRVTSNLIVVPVSVTDARGEPVQGLKVADFRLAEEGRQQEIAQVGDAEQVPLDIAILFDVSSSVTKKFEFQKQAAAGFLKQVLKPVDRAAIFTIAEKARMEQGLASAEIATAKLMTIPAADKPTGTAFYDSVTAAAKYLVENAPGRHRRVILVISDGEDNFSDKLRQSTLDEVRGGGNLLTAREKQQALHRSALQEVLREVQRADAVFYSINPSGMSIRMNVISKRAQEGMQEVADATGGSSFVPEEIEDLETVFRRIAAELRAQYLLQYYSKTEARKGTFLRIKVQSPTQPELRIRARQGYYVSGR
ncbi:MAG: VWA domain-containing protein [Acidobacteriota bacterium]|nr:VWA domain-containing protein [Acidobacteriota bacterium]